MTESDEDVPRTVSFLPSEPLGLSSLRAAQQAESVRDVWIPRGASADDLDCDEGDGWDLHLGFVPTAGIASFVLEKRTKIVELEFRGEFWEIVAETPREDIEAQVFAHRMKPFVTVRRAVEAKRVDKR